MSDEFSPEERELLARWSTPPPSPVVVDQVMARLPGRSWRGAAAIGAAAAAIVAFQLLHLPERGAHRSAERATLALGDRATVVVEAGGELVWAIDLWGAAVIEQPRGDVFYRVERGGPLVVHTPAGTVQVTGTSFRVEVENKMGTKTAAALGAGVGVVAASLVWVTVYEGSVQASTEAGALLVEAGGRAELQSGQPPTRRDKGPTTPSREPGVLEGRAALEPGTTPEESREFLVAERARLKAEVVALKEQLRTTQTPKEGGAESERATLDLDPETLAKMADKCELRWDTIPVGPEAPTLSQDWANEAELTEEEQEIVDRLFKEHHGQLVSRVQQAYREVTGDDTGGLSTYAMLMELDDKVPEVELKQVFQRLSAERAGRIPAPAELGSRPPVERVYRALTQSGDQLEQAIAKELGPEAAKRLRRVRDGWSSRSRSSYGCP